MIFHDSDYKDINIVDADFRTKSESPPFSRTFSRSDVLKDDDIFSTAKQSGPGKADRSDQL